MPAVVNNWSFDIIGQRDWDIWVVVCIVTALVLVSYAGLARLWSSLRGWVALAIIAIGAAGTAIVVAAPFLHSRYVGVGWTFAALVLLSATFYLNLLPQLGIVKLASLLLLRTIALAMLVSMLFDPVVRWVNRPKPERPLVFIVDASGSMSFPDVQNGPTRVQSVWYTLKPQLPFIKEHFIPHYFTFSKGLDPVKDPEQFAQLVADGQATDIVTAVNTAQAKVPAPDANFILISDGIDNTSAKVADTLRFVSRPVNTVCVGSDQAETSTMANIAVDSLEPENNDDFVVNHETKMKITVKSWALANRIVDVKMAEFDGAGKQVGDVAQQKLVLQPVAGGQEVVLPYKPRSVGVHKLAAWIDPVAGERSTVDNRQEYQGLALDPRIKVLYIEGRVRPEYRDLNRALARDPNIEVSTLLRIQQDRFASSGTVDGEKFTRMPQTLEEWKKFDVLILGDLDSSFLTKMQQESIEQLASGGAGILMIGGQNSFGPGSYEGTAIEKALPVFVGDAKSPQEKSEFVPRLTAEGATHPAMEGLADWFGVEDKKPTKQLPNLRGNVVVKQPKSGAQVLLTHVDRPGPDGKPQIVLAVERYGKGRSAAFTVDTTNLWYTSALRVMGQDSPFNRLWGQLVRWLAGEDVRNRQRGSGIEGLLNKSLYQLGDSVRVRAMVRDEKGDATRYAQVNLILRRVGTTEVQQLPMAPSEARTGMYDVTIPSPEKGDYQIELVASKDGKPLGKQTLQFSVMPPADEMLKIAANPPLMEELAKKTKGYFYRLEELPKLLKSLVKDPAAEEAKPQFVRLSNWVRTGMALVGKNPEWDKKYDLPMQGMLVISILAVEWILRRKWQLP